MGDFVRQCVDRLSAPFYARREFLTPLGTKLRKKPYSSRVDNCPHDPHRPATTGCARWLFATLRVLLLALVLAPSLGQIHRALHEVGQFPAQITAQITR